MSFFDSFPENAFNSDNYTEWRKIHGNVFGDVFTSAFEDSEEARVQLTAALIRVSKRDFEGGLSLLKQLEDFSLCMFDNYSLTYFIGLCYEFLEDEEQMNIYYEKLHDYDVNYTYLLAFHPYYRTAKFAQRRSENDKAFHYYGKALEFYSADETDSGKRENIGYFFYEIGTLLLSCKNYKKSRLYLDKSWEYSPNENPQRTYVMAILCAYEGNRAESERLVDSLPDYLKTECQRLLALI